MKKLLSILVTLILFISCKKDKEEETPSPSSNLTNISITASDFLNAGDIIYFRVVNDTNKLRTISIGSAGSNIIWDFSQLVKDTIDSIVTVNPANTPGAGYITNTNIAIKEGDNFYFYLNKTTDKIEMVGVYLNDGIGELKTNFIDYLLMLKFPSTLNTNFIDEGFLEEVVNYSGYWGKVRHRAKIESKIDATGTIKLPENQTFQCLREKRIEYSSDSIFLGLTQNGPWQLYHTQYDTVYSYNFLAKNAKFYIATIKVNNFTANKVTEFTYKRP